MRSTIAIPTELTPLARVFADAGAPVYAVGGFVRNALLGLPPADIDIASRLSPEELVTACEGTGVRVILKAAAFGTVELHFDGVSVEHTTFRQEHYRAGGSHRPESVTLGAALELDALRRDFSVNALYAALDTGEIIDPTGGLADLDARVLRTTTADPDEILASDALRVLRLVRLSGELGFTIAPATWDAARRHVGKLADISPERKRDELIKTLLCDAKYPDLPGLCAPDAAGERVLNALMRLDALDAWQWLIPALIACRGVAQRPDHHRYDVLNHSFHACAASPPDETLRLAALLHDVGKPACKAQNGNLHDHARMGEPIAREALTALRFPNAVIADVCALVRHHMYDIQGQAKEATLRVRFATWGRTLTQQLILLREADIVGCGYDPPDFCYDRWRTLFDKMQHDGTPFSPNELAVNGRDIIETLHLAAGTEVGAVKRRLFLHCARRPGDNTRARLIALMQGMRGVRA